MTAIAEHEAGDAWKRKGALLVPTAYETQIVRTDAPRAVFSLLDDMLVTRGDKSDWDLLHNLHYKAESLPLGPKFWKLTLHGQTIGVIVTGAPKGMLKERHMVFPNMKPGGDETVFTNTQRFNWINGNFRVISRFVIDTMFRGVGCGYRMMNLVARMEGKTFMEIQSSMSKFNYFGQKAGFKFVSPMNANRYDKGMRFLRSVFSSSPQDIEALIAEMENAPESQRERMLADCKDFYFKNSAREKTGAGRARGARRVAAMDERDIIKAIQQTALASPMYGIYRNPDVGTELPAVMPLLAFQTQAPNQRIVL